MATNNVDFTLWNCWPTIEGKCWCGNVLCWFYITKMLTDQNATWYATSALCQPFTELANYHTSLTRYRIQIGILTYHSAVVAESPLFSFGPGGIWSPVALVAGRRVTTRTLGRLEKEREKQGLCAVSIPISEIYLSTHSILSVSLAPLQNVT